MLLLFYYLLKVITCSAILYCYYYIALRNKIFHSWNRFYLLASIILSLAVPFIKINITHQADAPPTNMVSILQVIKTDDEIASDYPAINNNSQITLPAIGFIGYSLVSVILLWGFTVSLYKIIDLKRRFSSISFSGIHFINTNAKGTPFTFFKNIFWNEKIDIHSDTGKRIFKHELAHVDEMHSHDKIFVNILIIFFWINPFFWLYRRELNMIHEFIADKKSLEDGNADALAAMILASSFPETSFQLTNNFFYSPIKRRLAMITKTSNAKINYLSRLLILPLAILIFMAFTLRVKTINSYLDKKITVVIDAGHGGQDNGAMSSNIYEKDINLSIAKKIKEMNTDKNLNLIFTRDDDKTVSVKERVAFAARNHADLYISIHTNGESPANTNSGFSLMISDEKNAYVKESKLLGAEVLQSFKKNYPLAVPDNFKQRQGGLWVLDASTCPAILIEAGFLTTKKDLEFLIDQENQKTIAQNILNGIELYSKTNKH